MWLPAQPHPVTSPMTTPLRIGTDDFLLVRWSDIVRIRDRSHAEHLLENQRELLEDDRHGVLDQLAVGDLMLVRTEHPRPVLLVPTCDPVEPTAAAPSPAPAPRPPTWLAIEVRHGSGVGYPRAPFVLELPDGTERFEHLDDDSRWRADDIPSAGSCRIRFEPPLRLPPVAQRGEPRDLGPGTAPPITLQDRGTTPTRLPTATIHLLLVPKTTAHAACVGDVHFGTARAVVLPTRPKGRGFVEPTPLEAVADAIAHVATTDPRPFVLVAGHTDTAGTDATNDTLSQARATNVDLLLRGDAAGWAAHTQAHHSTADLQLILVWVHVSFGWPCDPGPIDGDLGPMTRAACRAFREGYNREFSGTLPLDADTGVPDWEAVFELYIQELAVLLSDLGGASGLWPMVRSRSLGTVACGERWPARDVGLDGYDCDDNRRVEILLFDIDDLPDLTHPEPGYDVYGSQRYRIVPVPPRPRFRLVRLQVLDWRAKPMPSTEYELADVEGAHAGTTDGEGFTEYFLMIEGKEDVIRIRVCGLEYHLLFDFDLESCASPVSQSMLNALGHFAGPLSGADGRQARAAVRNFQWLHHLPITGRLDAETTDAIRTAARR
jgi:Putative peptidoglycan binding domain